MQALIPAGLIHVEYVAIWNFLLFFLPIKFEVGDVSYRTLALSHTYANERLELSGRKNRAGLTQAQELSNGLVVLGECSGSSGRSHHLSVVLPSRFLLVVVVILPVGFLVVAPFIRLRPIVLGFLIIPLHRAGRLGRCRLCHRCVVVIRHLFQS